MGSIKKFMENWITPVVSVVVAVIMAIPGIWALIQQRRKEDATANKIKSDTKKTDVEISTIVQDVYQELVADLTKKSTECREEISTMSVKINEVIRQNNELIDQNKQLKVDNEKLIYKVEKLTEGVKVLISQLEREGIDPEYKILEVGDA